MEYLIDLVLLFFVYSFAGWCMEVILKYRQYHRFINRGFLTGPVCPIYGTGALLITVIIGNLARFESGIGTTFALSFLICGTVEYLTGYFLELFFHARWWDYSNKPMNLHGRVWIGNLVLFGVAGVAIIHLINPLIYRFFGLFTFTVRETAAIILLVILGADLIISYFVLKLVKVGAESSEADNTEEISLEVRRLLTNRSYFHKRFAEAYPEVIFRTERVKARMAEVKAEMERMQREAEQRLEERHGKISASLEPGIVIRNTVISMQDELITMVYDDSAASEEMKQLKAEIDKEKARLDRRAFAVKRTHRRDRKD